MKTYLMSPFRGNFYWATCVVAAVAIQLLACSLAATAEPGEERFAAMVNRARPSTTNVLPAGDYGEVALIRRDFSPAVTSGVRVCGNRVADFPHQSGTHHC